MAPVTTKTFPLMGAKEFLSHTHSSNFNIYSQQFLAVIASALHTIDIKSCGGLVNLYYNHGWNMILN